MMRESQALLLGILFLLSGCSDQAPERFDGSGTVTFKGQLVPAGQVVFSPDLSKGNDGPQGYADIKGGRYDTRETSTGAPSGAVVVRIEGFDGQVQPDWPYGKPLFLNYRLEVELPRETFQKDFEVPASASASTKNAFGPAP
jgi:hypothetical protein